MVAIYPNETPGSLLTINQTGNIEVRTSPGFNWGFIGDSITNGSSADNTIYAFPYQSCAIAGGAINRPHTLAGVPGQTSTQILARADEVIAEGITGLVVLAGTNDSGSAHYTDPVIYAANIKAIAQKAHSAGIPCIVLTVPPQGTGQTDTMSHRLVSNYNAYIRMVCNDTNSHVADIHAVLVDPVTGYLKTAYDSGDGIHPNSLGHFYMAQVVANIMNQLNPPKSIVDSLDLSDAVCIRNPIMAGTLGPDNLPSGWYAFGATGNVSVGVVAANGSLTAGQWFEIEVNATGNNDSYQTFGYTLDSNTYTTGDILAMTARIEVEDIAGNYVTTRGGDPLNAGGVSLNLNSGGVNQEPNWVQTPVAVTPPAWNVYTAVADDLNIWLIAAGNQNQHFKVRIGELQIYNLTKMRLVSELYLPDDSETSGDLLPHNATLSLMGDSVWCGPDYNLATLDTFTGIPGIYRRTTGPHHWIESLSSGRLKIPSDFDLSVGSETIGGAVAKLSTLYGLSPKPDIVGLSIGTQDLLNGYSVDDVKTSLFDNLITPILTYGCKIVIIQPYNLPGDGWPDGVWDSIQELNTYFLSLASSDERIKCAAYVDMLGTGYLIYDDMHPAQLGASKIGAAAWTEIEPWFANYDAVAEFALTTTSTNPYLTGTGGTPWPGSGNVLPDGYDDEYFGTISSTTTITTPGTGGSTMTFTGTEGDATGEIVFNYTQPSVAAYPEGTLVEALASFTVNSTLTGTRAITLHLWQSISGDTSFGPDGAIMMKFEVDLTEQTQFLPGQTYVVRTPTVAAPASLTAHYLSLHFWKAAGTQSGSITIHSMMVRPVS